ncbi:MAG TPA: HPr kinase/phosphorylase, partial [Eoetvoesiella sp.]
MLTIQELVADNASQISFTWVAGLGSAQRAIPDLGGSGADLVGHLNLIHPARIQVFGKEELSYYTRFETKRRIHHLEDLVAGGVPAILIAENLSPPDDLREFCNTQQVPLLTADIDAAQLIDLLRIYLGKRLASKTIMHGVFM